MSSRPWHFFLRPQYSPEIPTVARIVLAALSGAILSLSYRGAFWSLYSWFCIALLLITILGARAGVAVLCGFLHGLVFVLTCVPWIAEVLSVHGGMPAAAGWGVLLLIGSIWATLIGLFVSFLVVAFNSLLVWSYIAKESEKGKRRLKLGAAIAALLLAQWIGPRFVPTARAAHLARVVQPNFPESTQYVGDWYAEHKPDMAELEELSVKPSTGAPQPDLLIWPEAPAPFSFQDPHFGPILVRVSERFPHPFIVGIIEWKPAMVVVNGVRHNGMLPYNSAAMLNPSGQRVFSYDKIHLVPFGEYEPFPFFHQVVSSVSEEVGGFHKGKERSVGMFPSGNKFSVFICYEAIYAGEVRQFANMGAELLVNISNDGWFGTSQAAEQHLRMARVRAVENRRWVIRDTNNGITASIDPYGNVYRVMRRDQRNSADVPYDFRTDKTIYTRFGDWFAWMCVLVSAILVGITLRKGK
jgi:apolipoprotein N-acyltransferase